MGKRKGGENDQERIRTAVQTVSKRGEGKRTGNREGRRTGEGKKIAGRK